MKTGPDFQDCLPKPLFLCLWPLWVFFECSVPVLEVVKAAGAQLLCQERCCWGMDLYSQLALFGGGNHVLSNSHVWHDDHPVLSSLNHTHDEPHGCSWPIQSNGKAPFTFLSFFSSLASFFLQLQLMNFSDCLDVTVLAVRGCPLNAGLWKGCTIFPTGEFYPSSWRLGSELDECDRFKDWPWLLSPLVSFKGFEWHLGLLPVLVWRLHICELQEDAIRRAHLQVRGWAFWGKLFFIDSCLRKLGVLWTVNDLDIVIPLMLLLFCVCVCVTCFLRKSLCSLNARSSSCITTSHSKPPPCPSLFVQSSLFTPLQMKLFNGQRTINASFLFLLPT